METLHSTIETKTPSRAVVSSGAAEPSFVEALIDPVNVFGDPHEVVEHPWFTDEEKRTILLSWARDELVVEQVAKKVTPELLPKSRIDAVLEALSQFDPSAAGEYLSAVAAIRASHLRGGRRRRNH
jgi:hypothetical protein